MKAESRDAVTDLGLYLHVPFCKHACPYCDFYKLELRERPARERLEFPALLACEHELLLAERAVLAARPLASIYFGGGTPSTLSPAGVKELIAKLRTAHPMSEPEVTLEANPENLTSARSVAWRDAGVTRLSIGVQSFQERDLKRLERLHEPAAIPCAVANARAAGIDNLSVDLMFGLPDQSMEDWRENLTRAVDLSPDHVSFYGLTIHEETPFWSQRSDGRLREADEGLFADMYLEGSTFLRANGFEHYEISNFARPGRRSVHNQRYWSGADVLGLGPGAHSSVGNARWFNRGDLDAWRRCIAQGRPPYEAMEELDRVKRLEEELFRKLRRVEGFEKSGEAENAEAVFFAWLGSPSGEAALAEDWVEIVPDSASARLTERGWLVSDALLLEIIRAGINKT